MQHECMTFQWPTVSYFFLLKIEKPLQTNKETFERILNTDFIAS